MKTMKPRTLQVDDDSWSDFQRWAWENRVSASELFRTWVEEEKKVEDVLVGAARKELESER